MARKRDYAAEYARRQKRARALGFESYYERRTRGTPGAAKPSREQLAIRRGHRSSRDLVRELREGDLILCDITNVRWNEGRQWFNLIEKTVIPASLGPHREYTLRRVSRERLRRLIDQEIAKGAIFSPNPSQDQRRLDAESR